MSDEVTSEDIQEAAAQAAADGVQSVSVDGMSVTSVDPMKQLDVADRLKRNAASSNALGNILGNTRRLISPGAYE